MTLASTMRASHHSPASDDEWTVVGKKSLAVSAASSRSKATTSGVTTPPNQAASHSTRRRSQPDLASTAPTSRRPSFNAPLSAGGEDFSSFRKGAGTSRANHAGDWRRGSASAATSEPSSPGEEVKRARSASNAASKKKSQKLSLALPKSRSSRSATPPQPHAATHQVGHSRFSLGPSDFPHISFRRVMWAAERGQRQQVQAAERSTSPPAEVESSSEPASPPVEVAVDTITVIDSTPIELEVAVINAAEAEKEIEPETLVEADAEETQPLPIAVEPIVVPTPVEAPVEAPIVTKPKVMKAKKTIVAPVAVVEEPVQKVESVSAPRVANHRTHAVQVATACIGMLLLLAAVFPGARAATLPLAALMIAGLCALHHPSLESRLPIALRRESGLTLAEDGAPADTRARAHDFQPDKAAPQSHAKNSKHSASPKKKKHAARK